MPKPEVDWGRPQDGNRVVWASVEKVKCRVKIVLKPSHAKARGASDDGPRTGGRREVQGIRATGSSVNESLKHFAA